MAKATETYKRWEQRARQIVPDLLSTLVGSPAHIDMPTRDRSPGDFVVRGGDRTYIVEVKGSSRTAIVNQALSQLEQFAAAVPDSIALLVVPHMGATGAEQCRERNVSWLDLSGNADITAPGLRVHVEGKPNRFPERGRPSTPFAPAGMRVARALLQDPTTWRSARALSEVTHLPAGTVSKTLSRLVDLSLVERDDRRLVRPRDADLLLDSWAADYPFHLHRVTSWHAPLNSGIEVARVVSRRLADQGIRHATTGLAAAWLYDDAHTGFRTTSIFATDDAEFALRELGVREVDRGANLRLIEPSDPGVFQFGETIDQIPCVSRVQTYVDLPHDGERARDAADHLRERGLW